MKYSFVRSFVVSLSLLILPITAHAAEIVSDSKITKVMVFPSGAQVTREFKVELPVGAHEIVLKDLPPKLQGGSLRVEGEGPEGLEIGSLDHRVITVPFGAQSDKELTIRLKTELERLLDEKALADAQIKAAELQKNLLNEMTLLPSRQRGHGPEGGVDLSLQYSNLYSLIGDKFLEAQKLVLVAKAKIKVLDKEIKNIKQRLAEQPRGSKRATRLVVNVNAASGGEALFFVRYQVDGAGWRPYYEARLTTGEGEGAQLNLVRRAAIFQRTTEDWQNVQLRLSTSNPSGRVMAPSLHPWFVDFQPEAKPVAGVGYLRKESDESRILEQLQTQSKIRKGRVANVKRSPAKPRAVAVSFGTYQMTFDVTEPTSVMRNGEQKKVFLDRLDVRPKITLFTVPKKDRKAYLHASFANKTGNPLLAGQVSLFRDGVYVGRSHMRAVEPLQKTDIGFGVDPKVKVTWVRLDRVKGETGLISSSNSDVHRYKITINNGHKRAMAMTVFDQMPYAEQEDLQITLLKSKPRPDRENVDDKRGVMAWDLVVAPGAEEMIEFGYQLVWPKDKRITLR